MADQRAWLHLDLKGAPPRPAYLRRLCQWVDRQLPEAGWGLLLEFEDALAFQGPEFQPLGRVRDEWADALTFVHAQLGWPIMALMQTAGHLEFVLKHAHFRELREVAEHPQCLDCSGTRPEVDRCLRLYVDEVLGYFERVSVPLAGLHLGGDEVWLLGRGARSQAACRERGCQPMDLYLDHVDRLVDYVRDRQPDLRLLLWDDMLRHLSWDQLAVRQASLSRLEPVVWQYGRTLSWPEGLWERYRLIFSRIWCASAFKGATSSCARLPLLQHHVDNHLAWRSTIQSAPGLAQAYQGLILTGWQRFDHFSALCELLPVSVPSLVCCHLAFQRGVFTQAEVVAASGILGLDQPLQPQCLVSLAPEAIDRNTPTFPGGAAFLLMNHYVVLEHEVKQFLQSDNLETWYNPVHAHTGQISILNVGPLHSAASTLAQRLRDWWTAFEIEAQDFLFDADLDEWQRSFWSPKMNQLERLTQAMSLSIAHMK